MLRLSALVLVAAGLTSAAAGPPTPGKTPSSRDFTDFRTEVETLRGKPFRHEVPVYRISDQQLRAISDRELDKDFPGAKLGYYEELLAWLDVVPAHTDLKAAYGNFLVDQVAGLYDSDTKEMCLPNSSGASLSPGKKAAEKKLEVIAAELEDIVLAHEFTHALEDQYWPLDVPEDHDFEASTDRGTAHDFVAEGSATREMLEVIPGHWERQTPGTYFLLWNILHSGLGEWALNHEFSQAWKSPDALVSGVPPALARTEAMPYSFGYSFCTQLMRQWGMDGLDYAYNHPPVSSAQVMHPRKFWEWRDLPVQIDLPKTLPGGWKQVSLDSMGEAGIAVLFGCRFENLNRGLELARGWDGDHVGLYAGPDRHRLVLWASSWDSTNAAGRFARAWLKERQVAHQVAITSSTVNGVEWGSSDSHVGLVRRDGRRMIVLETDGRDVLRDLDSFTRPLVFTEPPEKAARAAANPTLRRFNPLWSHQKDGDYAISRSLCGVLSRHDRNSIGAADQFLLGLAVESRRTTSFHKWELGGGLLARHESEARRGLTKTTLLPWGVLLSDASARLPQTPEKTLKRTSVLWGLGASRTRDETDCRSVHVLPFGLLFRHTSGPGQSSFLILGTGLSRRTATGQGAAATRVRLLGLPLWTTRTGS